MTEYDYPPLIAIDGPAASGKTTIGQLLAERIGYLFLDTGCMYRAVTLAALQRGISPADEAAVSALARAVQIRVQPPAEEGDNRLYTVFLDGEDVTWEIRSPQVNAHVSTVSAYKEVREELVRRQRAFGKRGRVVMVGRDIGTVVLPQAPKKLYVTASAEERARRRWLERQQRGGSESLEEILADVVRRDQIDSSRAYSPLRPAKDAVIVDTTGQTPQQVLERLLLLCRVEAQAHQ